MNQLIDISKREDIISEYQDSPIGLLLEYHNLEKPKDEYSEAKLLVGMCMDSRKYLNIPDNFSYIIRSAGANLKYNEFQISYAISVGGIQHIALIGHNDCGMVNLNSRKDQFIKGLIDNAGWDSNAAEDYFTQFAPQFEIENAIDFILSETKRLRLKYPKVCIAPMHYNVGNNQIYLIVED
ncbi:MAG: carbonic anhydrase [Bacteroidetes bacterium]|nr:MAG: carbonic anhydrase [Bacteroidota bacterium]